jgi:aspartate aminotransferase
VGGVQRSERAQRDNIFAHRPRVQPSPLERRAAILRVVKPLSDATRTLKPSSTVAVNARALELKRQGVDVVSMAAGEPDFDTPEHIKNAARDALAAGKTKYTPSLGVPELREAIAAKFKRENHLEYGIHQIQVTTGGKQALYNACFALLNPGDEVIIPAPFWVTYPEQVRIFGGVPVFVDTDAEKGYQLELDKLEAAVTAKTKLIVLNSPSNPSGVVYSDATIEGVVRIAQKHDLWVMADEMYEHITYTGKLPASAARFDLERVITVNGASKAYSMTGWRIGFAAAPASVIKAMDAMQGQTTSNANTIAQWATIAAINDSSAYIETARAAFHERRDAIVNGLNAIGLTTPTPEGAFYVLADTTRIHEDETEAAKIILERARVAVVPGTDFRAPGRVRLSYACSLEQIHEAVRRIGELV